MLSGLSPTKLSPEYCPRCFANSLLNGCSLSWPAAQTCRIGCDGAVLQGGPVVAAYALGIVQAEGASGLLLNFFYCRLYSKATA